MPITFQTTDYEQSIIRQLNKNDVEFSESVAVDLIFAAAITRAERRLN